MADDTSINQLQAYIKQKRAEYISLEKTGYQLFFYSRFNSSADIFKNIGKPNLYHPNEVPNMQNSEIVPNAFLNSNIIAPGVASVREIKVSNSVSNAGGSTAELTIINPDNVEYFKSTIGSNGLDNGISTDYDYSAGKPIDQQRIGSLDTVIIRLTSAKTTASKDQRFDSETVFRGVIKSIHRTKSPNGGSMITIRLGDFSEILRNFTALPLGIFSTISFSITGRGLVANLVKYSNRLASGDWNFLGVDYLKSLTAQAFLASDTLLNETGLNQNVQQQTVKVAQNATNHKMYVPTFFYLEYSEQIDDVKPAPNIDAATQASQDKLSSFFNGDNTNQDSSSDKSKDNTSITSQVVTGLLSNIVNAYNASGFKQTPEDTETVSAYQVAIEKSAGNSQLNRYSSSQDAGLLLVQGAEKYAWIISDLYLDKKLNTFEHKRIWPTMFETGARSMREVYFDFAPKLKFNATKPYETATVPEYNEHPELPDIHPNIGIIKYRLSPALRAYDENGNTQIFQFSISDDDIVSVENVESEEEVFTAVFGFGSQLDSASISEKIKDIAVGQNQGLLAFAQSIDPQIEGRLGYRFMTNHDQKIKIPILIYLTSYVALMQSQMNMFTAQVTVTGNPAYKPGSIIRLQNQRIDYYCTDAIHSWSLDNGFTTTLILSYGHTSGILPTPLTGGSLQDNISNNEQCQTKSKALEQYIKKDVNIGAVNAHCLISAMWSFMTCGAPTDQAMQQATPEYENSGPKINKYNDWIDYNSEHGTGTVTLYTNSKYPQINGFQPYPFDNLQHQIINEIQYQGLDKYNVTYNLVKNLVGQESSYVQNVISFDNGYGLFQITPGNNEYITNPSSAISKAMQILKYFFKAKAQPGCSGIDFLNALAGYNGSPHYTFVDTKNGATKPYVNSVLGDAQVNQISSGRQSPSGAKSYSINSGLTCQPQGPNLPKWPYPVYGPIGQRLDAYKKRHSNVKDSDAKKALTSFKTGMTEAVSYITGLLNFYKDHDLPGAGGTNRSAHVHGNSLIEKVIAAWFCNEDISSMKDGDTAVLDLAIKGIKQAYQECQNCTGQTSSPVVGEKYVSNLALSQINFRYPCDNHYITGKWHEPRGASAAGPPHLHQGIDLVDNVLLGKGPCLAPADGIILASEDEGNNGWSITIGHGNPQYGIVSTFFDLANPTVKVGQSVKQGDVISYLAQAALGESGPHIHWEIRTNANAANFSLSAAARGVSVNPVDYVKG